VDIPVDLATLPVLVRAGAIIPMYPESLYDGQVPADPLTLDVYPHGESEFVIYEDDGNTRAYRDGAFSLQRVAVTTPEKNNRIEVTIDAAKGDFEGKLDLRKFVLRIHTRVAPEKVVVDGKTVTKKAKPDDYDAADRAWTYDPEDRFGTIHIKTGRVNTDVAHGVVVEFDSRARPAATEEYPTKPAGDGTITADALMVVSRAAEEPGHPLENAFDGNPDTWFRTVRDQSVAYGPHEFTLSLGGRRLVEGFRIRPRNDKYWKYGQVRNYEVYMADVNGLWGEPVATGVLEQTEEQQEVRFAPKAGRLLRFRVMSTHDDERDPMVLGAGGAGKESYDALAPMRVGPTTISEFRLLERVALSTAPATTSVAGITGKETGSIRMNGLDFQRGLSVRGDSRLDFKLAGDWHTLRLEAGIDDTSAGKGTVRLQVWGDGNLLWDSGAVTSPMIVKPRLDIRGVTSLSLRTIVTDPALISDWADVTVEGYKGDTINYIESPEAR
jgi:hypothetical protein